MITLTNQPKMQEKQLIPMFETEMGSKLSKEQRQPFLIYKHTCQEFDHQLEEVHKSRVLELLALVELAPSEFDLDNPSRMLEGLRRRLWILHRTSLWTRYGPVNNDDLIRDVESSASEELEEEASSSKSSDEGDPLSYCTDDDELAEMEDGCPGCASTRFFYMSGPSLVIDYLSYPFNDAYCEHSSRSDISKACKTAFTLLEAEHQTVKTILKNSKTLATGLDLQV